jgi:hypothetical protein
VAPGFDSSATPFPANAYRHCEERSLRRSNLLVKEKSSKTGDCFGKNTLAMTEVAWTFF